MRYDVNDLFEQHFTRRAPVERAPRRTNDEQQLLKLEQRYKRMGFDAREARFKARHYHSMKL